MLSSSMLSKSHTQRVHPQRPMPRPQERERGRSRTPKPTAVAPELRRQEPPRHSSHQRVSSQQISRSNPVENVVTRPPPLGRPPPQKGKSPDRSIPGSLEDAIHEAYARGDLRQCLQWVLEIQGIYLEWDDPRLDTVTEDDLCFSEQTGMGPDATSEERVRAEAYWALRQAEEDESQRVWELTASLAEKEASRRLRAKYEAEKRRREARAQFFRAPRTDKVVPPTSSPRRQATPSAPSQSLDSAFQPTHTIPRIPRSRFQALFPLDDGEFFAVRLMWQDQGRKGLALVEALIRPPAEPSSTKPQEIIQPPPEHQSSGLPHNATPSTSVSSSSSSSAPSALFSSVITTASSDTSVSTTIASPESPSKPCPSPPKPIEAPVTIIAPPKFIPVSTSESPLHTHLAYFSLQKALEEDDDHYSTMSAMPHTNRPRRPRNTSSTSGSWLTRGSKTVGGLVDLVGRLPGAYLPLSDRTTSLRTASCPPSIHRIITSSPSPTPNPPSFIYLLPLRPPTHLLTFPPLPTLPRSPYRPLTPPSRPTLRARCVPNPQFLRLKALQNRVLWGLLPVPRSECDMLADIARRHRMDATSGRPDVDRLGQMFTAREALVRVCVEGVGASRLRYECVGAPGEESAGLWGWLRVRG